MHINLGNYHVPNDTKDGICVDIGSNLGDFTAKYLGHFSKIIFIEPQISLFQNLQNRFKEYEHVIGLNKAVWETSNVDLELVWHDNLDCGSVGVKGDYINDHWTEKVVNEVKSISFDDLFKELNFNTIDYLKLDCETSEYPFLYAKNLSKIRYIGVELHFQLGEQRYDELLNWIYKTHALVNGDASYSLGVNKEVLFKLKS
jgi:FkbM family methyltransferase